MQTESYQRAAQGGLCKKTPPLGNPLLNLSGAAKPRRAKCADFAPSRVWCGGYTATWCEVGGAGSPSQSGSFLASQLPQSGSLSYCTEILHDPSQSARLVGSSGESGLARGSVTLSVSPECLSFAYFLWHNKKWAPRRDRSINDYRMPIY